MKRPNRNISILSMSALDVLAMATGVFVLLLVMLMPYYRKTMDAYAEIDAARVATAAAHAEVQSLQTTAARYRADAGAATQGGSRAGRPRRRAGAGGPAEARAQARGARRARCRDIR